VATVTTAQSESSVGSFLDRGQLEAMSFTTMMVHLDVERDCEQRVQLALALADRFQAALIGVAGLALRLLSPRGVSSSIASPRNMSAARRAHVSMTSARSSANKASISKRLNGAPRLNCRMSSCRARPERRISSSSEHGILGVTCRTLPIPA